MTFLNGRATHAQDASEVDRYATFLAASWKPLEPAFIGAPLTAINTATPLKTRIYVPPYTPHLGFVFVCTGQGTITVTSTSDAFNAVNVVEADDGTGTPSTHDLDNATVVWMIDPVTGTAANGVTRALDVTAFSAFWSEYVITIQVANKVASRTLKVHTVVVYALQPELQTLP